MWELFGCPRLTFPFYPSPAGVFLIIYFISMIFCGIPIFLLEVAMGQYLGAGGMTAISQLVPILKGELFEARRTPCHVYYVMLLMLCTRTCLDLEKILG